MLFCLSVSRSFQTSGLYLQTPTTTNWSNGLHSRKTLLLCENYLLRTVWLRTRIQPTSYIKRVQRDPKGGLNGQTAQVTFNWIYTGELATKMIGKRDENLSSTIYLSIYRSIDRLLSVARNLFNSHWWYCWHYIGSIGSRVVWEMEFVSECVCVSV